MAMEFKKKIVLLSDLVDVEDAERLLQWLQNKSGAMIDLSGCTHIHPANIQVLMAAGAIVIDWPRDADLALWLKSALASKP